MTPIGWLRPDDLDEKVEIPEGINRVLSQGLCDFTPWHMMNRDAAKERLLGLRKRFSRKYFPFARRQDNDDLACVCSDAAGQVVVVHDFADDGHERRETFVTFWDWFRAAIEDMIAFD